MKAPSSPDPVETAAAQTASNKETATTQQQLNMVDQVTPYGTLTYQQTGTWADGTPKYSSTQTLSDSQSAINDQLEASSLNLAELANSQTEWLQGYLGTPTDLSFDNVSKYMSNTYDSAFNKQWDKNSENMQNQLISSGIRPGSAAYTQAMSDYNDQKSSAYNSLLNDSYSTGVQTLLAQRNQPLNELSAILGGSQVTTPTYTSTPQASVANTDVAGITNQAYQNEVSAYNSTMGGLGGLFGGLTSIFSDERLKTDIRRVGTTDAGQAVYTYRYGGYGPYHMGVMAQESPEDAVTTHESGYLMVDYSKVK